MMPVASSNTESALVLLSGGQDSATCLAWALEQFDRVETVGFQYGQRHAVEMELRPGVRAGLTVMHPDWSRRLGPDHVLDLGVLGQISDTALTSERAIELGQTGLPNTFVPGRNLLFLTLASALAYRRGLDRLVGGMCETDFSGYPDCRRSTLDALEQAIALGMDRSIPIDTPLMHLDKAATWALAKRLGGRALVDLIVEGTHTCYLADRSRRHAWGYGCGSCPACELRARGWELFQAGQAL